MKYQFTMETRFSEAEFARPGNGRKNTERFSRQLVLATSTITTAAQRILGARSPGESPVHGSKEMGFSGVQKFNRVGIRRQNRPVFSSAITLELGMSH